MNAFLVVIRYSMDDIPLLLTSGRDEAMEVAKAVKPTEFRDADKTVLEGNDADAQRVLSLNATDPLAVAIYEFTHGRLTGVVNVQDFVSDEHPART